MAPHLLSRRQFAARAGSALAALAGVNCRASSFSEQARAGRIAMRPRHDIPTTAAVRNALGLARGRDGILQLPATIPATPMPLVVLLHGAGGSGDRLLERFGSAPSDAGVAVLAPDSRGQTWDAIRGSFGPDIAFLDRALDKVFGMISVDPDRLAVGGFSDGATYALSVGLINGDVFRRIAAFSTGFVIPGTTQGKPRIFMSHGTSDEILPIDLCSRAIVPALRRQGYDVTFREFAGGHEVPTSIAVEGFKWIAGAG